MNTAQAVPLIDGSSLEEMIRTTTYQSSDALKHELSAWGIDNMGINFDAIDHNDMSLLKKFILHEVLWEKKFGDDIQRSHAFSALSQTQIKEITQKIQAYIDWYWRPKRTMRNLWNICHKKWQAIDGLSIAELKTIIYPLTVSFQYTFEDESDELQLLRIVDRTWRQFEQQYTFTDKTWEWYLYAVNFQEELQYQISNEFDGIDLHDYDELNAIIAQLSINPEQQVWMQESVYHYFKTHWKIVESFITQYVPQTSQLVNALSKYKIALVTSIVLIYAQSHFKQSPDTQFSVEQVLKKEIVLDQDTQEKVAQEISIAEHAISEHTTATTKQITTETTQHVSDTLELKAPSLDKKVVTAVRETFAAPAPLKSEKLKPVHSINTSHHRERIMTKESLGEFILMKDPLANVYFRKVKAGQTLGEVHRALQQDERFAYLNNDSYDPSKSGNVFGWNIKSGVLQPGMLVPVPLDRAETLITQKAFIQSSGEAVDAIKSHPTYGNFVTWLEKDLGRNHLMKIMVVFASKESDMGSTQLHRFEPHHQAYSYSLFHILDEWPWRAALQWLWFTVADVMNDPAKASQWFRAYRYEKFDDLKNNKNFGKRYDTPSKFFAKSNLKTCWKLYNGSASYGTELKKRWKELFK